MARIEDIPEPTRTVVQTVPCPSFATQPWVEGPPMAQRRVAIINSAGMFRHGEMPFQFGGTEFRTLPNTLAAGEMLMSHVSINFDRSGFQRDINAVHPVDRLRELAAEGVIGGVAETHYSILGSTDPEGMAEAASAIAAQLRQERVNAVVLSPV